MRIASFSLAVLAAAATLSGCGSTRDFVSLATPVRPDTAPAPSAAPVDRIWVRLARDSRGLEERGSRRPGGRSYIGTSRLREPLEVSILKIVGRGAVAWGLAGDATYQEDRSAGICEVSILRLHGSWTEGIENLMVVLPTSRVDAAARLRLVWRDSVGRILATVEAERSDHGLASALQDPEDEAVRLLSQVVQEGVGDLLLRLSTELSRRPESRSSIAR